MAGAEGPEWVSHVLGKRPWSVHSACIAANAPIEDRIVVEPCAEGLLAGVLDGHYGPRTAEWTRQNARVMMTEALREEGGAPVNTMNRFYELIEDGWANSARGTIREGDWSAAMEGSCALVAYVTNKSYVLGNLGDCRALLVKRKPDGTGLTHEQLTKAHNASDPAERQRIQQEHPNEKEPVTYLTEPGTWYVRGTLQVTRAVGDLFLKRLEFFNALPSTVRPVVGPEPFSPPYVSHQPDVVVRDIDKDDMYLVLASDGLWDELSNREVTEILRRLTTPNALSALKRMVSGEGSPVQVEQQEFAGPNHMVARASLKNGLTYDDGEERNAGQRLLWGALLQNPVSRRYGVQYLTQIPPGRQRRSAHDDISVVVIFLSKDAEAGVHSAGPQKG